MMSNRAIHAVTTQAFSALAKTKPMMARARITSVLRRKRWRTHIEPLLLARQGFPAHEPGFDLWLELCVSP